MIQFPNADVWVLTDSGQVEAVSSSVRIDILFGLGGFDFEAAYAEALKWEHGADAVRILGKELLKPTAALKLSL